MMTRMSRINIQNKHNLLHVWIRSSSFSRANCLNVLMFVMSSTCLIKYCNVCLSQVPTRLVHHTELAHVSIHQQWISSVREPWPGSRRSLIVSYQLIIEAGVRKLRHMDIVNTFFFKFTIKNSDVLE
jgi:hypothetical protein